MTTSVLIVERPGQFRDALLQEVKQRGVEAHVHDDAMEALASLSKLSPNVVLVSDDPGPPGALSLCRLLRRKFREAAVYRLGEPSPADVIDERSVLLPRAAGFKAIANAVLERKQPAQATAWSAHRAWSAPLGSLELGPLLLAIGSRWLTGRLILTRPGVEREIAFVRGVPVHAGSSVLTERLGAVGLRRGLFNETQLEQALDLAHARGLRVGEALLELGALDAPRLFAILSAQLMEQLVAACNAGTCHARFMLDHTISLRVPLLRLSPLTALLHAVQQTSHEDVERVLDELADRPLSGDALAQSVTHWLTDLQFSGVAELSARAKTVRALRSHLREHAPPGDQLPSGASDEVTLALLRGGAFGMPGRTSLVPNDLRAGMRTLSPPSIASAVVRCAHTSFDDWPVSAFAQARTPIELGIDDYLHGQRAPETARALALRGPEADYDPAHAEVYALYLRTSGGQRALAGLDSRRGATVSELRVRCHEMQKRLDLLETQHTAPIARAQIALTRVQIEQLVAMLPELPSATALGVGVDRAPVSEAQTSRISLKPDVARSVRPPARTHEPVDGSLAATVEPLVQQGKWHELRTLLASHTADPQQLSPGLLLLYAIALKEEPVQTSGERDVKPSAQAEALGIRAVSQLLDVSPQSAMALVIAKRALRLRQPLDWSQKPPARVSALLVVAALVAGAFVGLLLHPNLLSMFWK